MSRGEAARRRRERGKSGADGRTSPAVASADSSSAPIPAEPLWVGALLAAALLLRLATVLGTFLSPDEAIFAGIAQAADLGTVYRLTTEQAHPPLYFLLLHFWGRFAGSDLALRLPSILSGTAAVGLLWLFVRRAAGPLPALVAAALLALSPSVVDLTSEARQYSLLLLLVSGALLAATPRDRDLSVARIAAVGTLLVAAEATHYSAFLFAAALLGALAAGFLWRPPGRGPWIALAAAGAVVATVAVLLWTIHAATLRGGTLEEEARTGWLREFYWQRGEGLAGFLASAAAGVFDFILGSAGAGAVAALVVVATLALRARRDARTALVLAVPFLAAFAASALRLYPLGASRHSAWLFPAAVAALALPFARVKPGTVRWGLPVLATLAALWSALAPRSAISTIPRASRRTEQIQGLVAAISRQVGPGEPLFVDTQTYCLLHRYLAGTPFPPGSLDASAGLFRREEIGGRDVWVSRTWLHDAPTFLRELRLLREQAGLERGRPVWVVNGGSGSFLLPQLSQAYPAAPVTAPAGFGGFLWIFRIAVP